MPAAPQSDPLYASFPKHASRIVESDVPLLEIRGPQGVQGYAAPLSRDGLDPLPVTLPADGADAVHFYMGQRGEIAVRHLGMQGRAWSAGSATAYALDIGTSYWTAQDGQIEEWLVVDQLTEGVVATYQMEGAAFQQKGDTVSAVGDDGIAWLDVDAPEAWSADGQRVDVWLEARGTALDVVIEVPEGARAPLLIDPVWTRSDDLNNGRLLHTATRMLDGRVLVAGGVDEANQVTATAEIFNPNDGSWTAAASMPHGIRSHAQVLLDDGRVLLTHGKTDGSAPQATTAFLYDPISDSWATADPTRSGIGSLSTRLGSRSVKLPNGKVLMSGNWCCPGHEAHIYDPVNDTFQFTSPMNVHRLAQAMQVLPDGSVLVAGGGTTNYTGLNSNTAELLVPDNSSPDPYIDGTWVNLPNMNAGHMDTMPTLLTTGPDAGKVLICGGLDGATVPGSYFFTTACDLFDPNTQTWSTVPDIPGARQRSGTGNGGDYMVQIEGGNNAGKVVFAGGWPSIDQTDIYDPVSGIWTTECPLTEPRLRHHTVALEDDSVLIVGGQTYPWTQGMRVAERLQLKHDDDCDGIANPFDVCPSGGCGILGGRVFADDNEDCGDLADPGVANALVRAERSSGQVHYAVTDLDGYWSAELRSGMWDITVIDSRSTEGTPACGGAAQSYTVNTNSSATDLDFSMKSVCDAILSIDSHSTGDNLACGTAEYRTPCPGNQWEYCFHNYNNGSPWTPGPAPGTQLTITLPEGMAYTANSYTDPNGCGVTELSADFNGSVWEVVFDMGGVGNGVDCTVCTPVDVTTLPAGGWITTSDLLAQCAGSSGSVSETLSHTETDACGCDPNDKAVFPAGCDDVGTLEVAEPLNYTVRFQNTGLGPAHDVSLIDSIDPDLDIESLFIRGSSHNITGLQIDDQGQMFVRYEDIELPAAQNDPTGSQGYIQYQLDMAITSLDTEYSNYADIYFDANEVVVTNEVLNTMGVCDVPPGLDDDGPARSGLSDGSNPGQGAGTGNSPSGGTNNPNQAGN